jgi:hypothetical protein
MNALTKQFKCDLNVANWMCFSAEIFSPHLYIKIFTTQHNAVCCSHTHLKIKAQKALNLFGSQNVRKVQVVRLYV